MSNRFRNVNDHVYRVVGELPSGELEVLQGPYANKGVAKGLATKLNNSEQFAQEKYGVPFKYVRIYAQETVPVWTEI